MQKEYQNLRLQKTITIIAIVLLVIKLVAWYLTHSVAILTDALESIVNVAAGLIGVYSLYISAKPKDMDHPYGHGKVEFLTSAIEGTLITVAGIIIIYEAIKSLIYPHEVSKLNWGILLVAATGIINYIVGAVCVNTGKKNNSLVLIASGKHLQSDTYSTLGIVVGLILLYFLKFWWIDNAVAILFAFIIIFTGYKIVRTSVAGIMDETDAELMERMVKLLNANRREDWMDCHNLRIIKNGPDLHLDCHLTVPWYFNMNEAHEQIDVLADLVKKEFGDTMELFVHTDGCKEFSCPICTKHDCPVRQHAFQQKIEWTMENIIADCKHQL